MQSKDSAQSSSAWSRAIHTPPQQSAVHFLKLQVKHQGPQAHDLRWRGLDGSGPACDSHLFPGCIANKAQGKRQYSRSFRGPGKTTPESRGVVSTFCRCDVGFKVKQKASQKQKETVVLQGGGSEDSERSTGSSPSDMAPHARLKLRASPERCHASELPLLSPARAELGLCLMFLSSCFVQEGVYKIRERIGTGKPRVGWRGTEAEADTK